MRSALHQSVALILLFSVSLVSSRGLYLAKQGALPGRSKLETLARRSEDSHINLLKTNSERLAAKLPPLPQKRATRVGPNLPARSPTVIQLSCQSGYIVASRSSDPSRAIPLGASLNAYGQYSVFGGSASPALQVCAYFPILGARNNVLAATSSTPSNFTIRTLNSPSRLSYLGAVQGPLSSNSTLALGSSNHVLLVQVDHQTVATLPPPSGPLPNGNSSYGLATGHFPPVESVVWGLHTSTLAASASSPVPLGLWWTNPGGSSIQTTILYVEMGPSQGLFVATPDVETFEKTYGPSFDIVSFYFTSTLPR